MKVFHNINHLQFSIVRKTTLSYDLLYFCLPAGRFTEVCVIVIVILYYTDGKCMMRVQQFIRHFKEKIDTGK